jgi:hypothetical protein
MVTIRLWRIQNSAYRFTWPYSLSLLLIPWFNTVDETPFTVSIKAGPGHSQSFYYVWYSISTSRFRILIYCHLLWLIRRVNFSKLFQKYPDHKNQISFNKLAINIVTLYWQYTILKNKKWYDTHKNILFCWWRRRWSISLLNTIYLWLVKM